MPNYSKVINGLIPIEETFQDGQVIKLVNARQVHEFLGVKKKFADWIRFYVLKYNFKEGVDYFPFRGNIQQRGRESLEYNVTMDTAKELCLVSRAEKGHEARMYFIETEKKYVNQVVKPQVTMGEETSKLFNTILASVKGYSDTAAQTVGIKMLEAYGVEVPHYAHPLEVETRWTATQIAKELGCGISNNRVGRVAKLLDLQKQPFAVSRLSGALKNNREVPIWWYNQRAKDKIKDYLFPNQNLLN